MALRIVRLGEIAYERAWDLQKEIHAQRARGDIEDTVLLLQHPHTLTVGTRGGKQGGRWASLKADAASLRARGVSLVEVDRGGDITWHGPGQMVIYPIVGLARYQNDVGRYVRMLESVILHTLEALGIGAERLQGFPGVWIEGPNTQAVQKIAAVGARIRARVTMHGVALNVRGPLEGFDWIVPCGLEGKGVTSIERQLPPHTCPSDEAVLSLLEDALGAVFDQGLQRSSTR